MKYLDIGLIFISLFFVNVVDAEDEVFSHLLGAKCLKCSFKEGVSTSWNGKGVKVESDKWKGDTIFDSIDIKQGKARIVGNRGASDVILIGSPSGITFIKTRGRT